MLFFMRTLRNAIITISPILFISGCSGDNPVNQIVELIKNELIPIVDKNKDKIDDTITTNDFSGCWNIKQSTGDVGTINLTQSDCAISGTTAWENHENGKITGTVKGSTITFTVAYPSGDTVTYSAMLNDDAASITGGKAQSTKSGSFLWDAVKGTCTAKTVDGCWAVDQNNGHVGILTFKQNGSAITGISGWTTHSNGPMEGTVDGDKISFTITYPEGVIGYYEATISSDGTGLINGITKSSTGDKAQWNAKKTVCEVKTPSIQGCWAVDQNNGHVGILTFQQSGSTITGTSGWTTHSNGPINGTINGTTLSFTITYGSVIGYYDATVSDDGTALINGITKSSTGDKAQWNAKKTVCEVKTPNIQGCWAVDQNNGHVGILTFQQSGSTITGTSGWTTHSNGPINGTINGTTLSFTITYGSVIGYYDATISDDGTALINGITKSSTGDQAQWNAKKTVCEVKTPSIQGCWAVDQNNGHVGILTFQQSGSTITGTSGWTTHSNGPINGTINGTTLSFTITYGSVIGYYDATVSDDGTALINGITKSSTGDYADWVAEKTTCTPQTNCFKYELDASTLALFHCNEESGNVLLDETKLWNGNIYGDSVKRILENCNGFLHFSNQNYALFGTIIPDGLPQGTVEFDLMFSQSDDITGTYGIFGTDGARIHFIYNNGVLYFLKNHSNIHKNVYAKFTPKKEIWYHIAATWGSKGMRLFVNDQLVASNSDTSCFQSSPRGDSENLFHIGKKSWFGMEGIGLSKDLSFNGNIDEIRVSSVARY